MELRAVTQFPLGYTGLLTLDLDSQAASISKAYAAPSLRWLQIKSWLQGKIKLWVSSPGQNRHQQTTVRGPKLARCLHLYTKFCWHTATHLAWVLSMAAFTLQRQRGVAARETGGSRSLISLLRPKCALWAFLEKSANS